MPAPVIHHSEVVNGLRIHYVVAGTGNPLVLLHGWPQHWYAWRKVIPALSERFTVIAPDLRGLGDSEVSRGAYDKRTLATDIRELIYRLGYDKIAVAAHDYGGQVGYYLAYDNPGLVSHLAVLDILPWLVRAGEPVDLAFATKLWQVFFHAGNPHFAAQIVGNDIRGYLTYFLTSTSTNYSPAVFSPEDIDEYVRVYSRPGVLEAGFRYYEAALAEDAVNIRGCTKRLDIPVLALGAANFLGDIVPAWGAIANDVQGHAILNCGHFIPEEQPDEVITEFTKFFP